MDNCLILQEPRVLPEQRYSCFWGAGFAYYADPEWDVDDPLCEFELNGKLASWASPERRSCLSGIITVLYEFFQSAALRICDRVKDELIADPNVYV